MSINAKIYIARHERAEAAEAYIGRLTEEQLTYLRENDGDFWLIINSDGPNQLLLIEDEG